MSCVLMSYCANKKKTSKVYSACFNERKGGKEGRQRLTVLCDVGFNSNDYFDNRTRRIILSGVEKKSIEIDLF